MGHYWSEMRGADTPAEEYEAALDQAKGALGYRKFKIEYTTLHSCNECGSVVSLLRIHCANCPANEQPNQLEQQVAQAIEMILSLARPTKRMDLVELARDAGINVFALDCALEDLLASRRIIKRGGFGNEYADAVITVTPSEEDPA